MSDIRTARSAKDNIIDKVEIISPSGRTENITYHFDVISIFENIFSPVITGYIQITDAINLYSQLGFNGTEYIRIKFKKPGESTGYLKTFRIYKCTGRQPKEENQSQVYTLHFCSEEMIFSNQQTISTAFKNESSASYIVSILKRYLKVNSSRLQLENFEDSLGLNEFVITKQKPFDAIEMIMKYAHGFRGSPFLFYENSQGFNFKSLEKLLNQEPISTLNYSTAKLANDPTNSAYENSNELMKFVFDNSFDMYNSTNKAAFAGTLHTLDLVRQKYTTINNSLTQRGADSALLDKRLPVGFAKNRDGKTVFEEYGSNVKYALTNLDQTNSQYFLDRGIRVQNTNIEKVLMQREMQLALLNNTKVRCTLPGNPGYAVGFVVDFNLPGFTKEEKSERMIDPYQSGKYLITAVRHTFAEAEGYETALELCKNSAREGYGVPDNNQEYKRAVAS